MLGHNSLIVFASAEIVCWCLLSLKLPVNLREDDDIEMLMEGFTNIMSVDLLWLPIRSICEY